MAGGTSKTGVEGLGGHDYLVYPGFSPLITRTASRNRANRICGIITVMNHGNLVVFLLLQMPWLLAAACSSSNRADDAHAGGASGSTLPPTGDVTGHGDAAATGGVVAAGGASATGGVNAGGSSAARSLAFDYDSAADASCTLNCASYCCSVGPACLL